MGNQLVSSVKVVIRPIDYYLAQVPEQVSPNFKTKFTLEFKYSLGQTQFLKVALCHHSQEGNVVVKVLSHEDPSLLLEPYRLQLEEFNILTKGNVSIAAFRFYKNEPHFAFMVRQFVRYTLYDRLSTRPFLTHIEKCWIVYQIFKCMAWCHEKGLRHGDLKLENVLLTSSLWVIIADFATYKPVNLPEDNPTIFNYFFDSSRRRCCNIAPERFVSSSLSQLDHLSLSSSSIAEQQQQSISASSFGFVSNDVNTQPLTNKMDLFSIGCILAEMFSDNVLFDLSGLLHYRDGKSDKLESRLKQISNETIRELVANLTSLAPSARKSCDQVLSEQKGKLFPRYFDKLFVLVRTLVRLPPDSQILYLSQELELYLPMILEENSKGVLILLTTVTSSLRSLQHIHCKLEAQRIICQLVACAPSVMSVITDRLIPYLANCLQDTDHRVRGEAIKSITLTLEQVTRPPPSDSNLFTDYLLEILLNHIIPDKSIYVRLCLARYIGRLSKIALHFLNQSVDKNYEEELALLHSYFQNLVSMLLTDANHCVRRTLLLTPENCSHLCTFFGRQKTNEVILSHIITFLNDKNDFQLRLSFFDNIVLIASFLGVQCSPILYPLLQQGLCDGEEILISKAIDSVAALVEHGLLQKNIIYELMNREILPLLYHPSQWIRHSLVHFLSVLGSHLSFIDLNSKVHPMLSPFLARNICSISNRHLLLNSLKRPLPRSVFDTVLDIFDESLFRVLTYRDQLRRRQRPTSTREMDATSYRRLLAENIDDEIEQQLLTLSPLIRKVHRNKRNYQMPAVKRIEDGSVIHQRHCSQLTRSVRLINSKSVHDDSSSTIQIEWEQMFGSRRLKQLQSDSTDSTIVEGQEANELFNVSFMPCPPCSKDVKMMLAHRKSSFTPAAVSSKTSNLKAFRPNGFLVSHLQEHKASVNQIARYGDSTCFFSASDDGTIRLWDLAGFENRYVINRSKYLFKMEFSNGSLINFKGLVCCGSYLITYTNEGIIVVFVAPATSSGESSLTHLCSFKAGSPSGPVSPLITSLVALSATLFAVSLTDSFIYCYDVRNLNSTDFFIPVFKLQMAPSQRTISALAGNEVALFAGTAHGHIATFDLRFHLKVNQFCEASHDRISRLVLSDDGLFASVVRSAEVILWDYKLGQKQKTLRPHLATDSTVQHLQALLPVPNSGLITGGSDMRLRYWDLNQPERSYIISDNLYRACNYCLGKPSIGSKAGSSHSPSRLVDLNGVHSMAALAAPPLSTFTVRQEPDDQSLTIEEVDCSSHFGQFQATQYCAVDQQFISTAHRDTITDLLMVNQFLISAGRNGAIKVWR